MGSLCVGGDPGAAVRGVEGVGSRVEGVRLVGACVRLVGVVRTGTWRGEGAYCIQLAVVQHITACLVVESYNLEAFGTRTVQSSSVLLQETSWDCAGLGVGKIPVPYQAFPFLLPPFQIQAAWPVTATVETVAAIVASVVGALVAVEMPAELVQRHSLLHHHPEEHLGY